MPERAREKDEEKKRADEGDEGVTMDDVEVDVDVDAIAAAAAALLLRSAKAPVLLLLLLLLSAAPSRADSATRRKCRESIL